MSTATLAGLLIGVPLGFNASCAAPAARFDYPIASLLWLIATGMALLVGHRGPPRRSA
jgi:hypothetical protein